MAAFGASVVASDRVAGAELLQKDIAERRREAREAAEALRRDAETPDEDEGDGSPSSEDDDDASSEDDDEEEYAETETETSASASEEEDADAEEEERDVDDVDDVDDVAALESDSDGRVIDPVTGKKRKRLAPALSMAQKRELAKAAVAAAEASGAPAPKVRKNGVLSLSELRRRAREAAKSKREAESTGDGDSDSDSEAGVKIEHDRILGPEDFKRIKALRTAGQLGEALDKSGGRKASATGAEEIRRMLRAADKSAQADRRVDPDALAAVGMKRAHDKASRVASIMAGREDRGVFGAAKDRKNKKAGGTSNVEKAKKKNLPLAARVKAAKNRRTSFVSKRVKDKQFKGRFRK